MLDVVPDKREDLTEFTRGELAARKLDRYKDVWEIVASNASDEEAAAIVPVSKQGRLVLDLLVSAWEWEAQAELAEGTLRSSSSPSPLIECHIQVGQPHRASC